MATIVRRVTIRVLYFFFSVAILTGLFQSVFAPFQKESICTFARVVVHGDDDSDSDLDDRAINTNGSFPTDWTGESCRTAIG